MALKYNEHATVFNKYRDASIYNDQAPQLLNSHSRIS